MTFLVKINAAGHAGKVHEATALLRPVCGGGRGGKSVTAWQQDLGPESCRRCKQISSANSAKALAATEQTQP